MSFRQLMTESRIRFIRFCAVGASGVLVNLAIYSLFRHVVFPGSGLDDDASFMASNGFGFLVSVLTNFLLNDFWTWGDREKRGHAHFASRLSRFYLVSSLAGVVQIGVAQAVRVSFGVVGQVAVLCGIAVATGINFVANNLWTFKEPPPKPAPTPDPLP